MRSHIGYILMILFLLLPPAAAAAVIHVPGDQPTIQAGIDAATSGDTVLVADGTYTGPDNRALRFWGKAIIVRSAGGPEACIIDCQNSDRGVYFRNGESFDSVLQGFTIRNGYTDYGGAIRCGTGASPTITGNVLTANTSTATGGAIQLESNSLARVAGNTITVNSAASYGGGIYCNGSQQLIGNRIIGNTAGQGGGAIYCAAYSSPRIQRNRITGNTVTGENSDGGGIKCADSSSPKILDNTITGNSVTGYPGYGGGVSVYADAIPRISRNRISGNSATRAGGGIAMESQSFARIEENTITGNSAVWEGGGIWGSGCDVEITGNFISGNSTETVNGGGIFLESVDDLGTIADNLITGNSAGFPGDGGGLSLVSCTMLLDNNTIVDNLAGGVGGGLWCSNATEVTMVDSILWGNDDGGPPGDQIGLDMSSSIFCTYSDVQGGSSGLWLGSGCYFDWGFGMLDVDPLFTSGPLGSYYLSQAAAGQTVTSPCVNSGDPSGPTITGTTRTDSLQDAGVVDMGHHVAMIGLVAGPGRGYDNPPRVRVLPPEQYATPIHEFAAYSPTHYGVNVSCGDVDADGRSEILTGAGPGAIYGPHVRGFDIDGTPLPGLSFLAYGTNKFGVNVAAGDLDGNGWDEIITGAGPGAVFGPHVRAFYYVAETVFPVSGVSFLAYGTNKWGVNVAAGDIDGDGMDEIVTGAGPGAIFGPHVRGWNYDGSGATAAIPSVNFLAYGTNKYGVVTACGDVDADGIDEIITAPGPGSVFSAHVRGWNYDGGSVTALPGFSFFAYIPEQARYGARVFSANINSDTRDELLVGLGPDSSVGSSVAAFRYNGSEVSKLFEFDAFPAGYTHGANAAAGRF